MKQIQTDVLVIGGGTAGVMAAIAAAEEGAGVVMLERDNALGGVGVRAGVHFYYYGSHGGVQKEVDRSTVLLSKRLGNKALGFHPEMKGMAIEQRIAGLDIRVIYEAIVAEMAMEGNLVRGAIVESESESLKIEARVTVDCTGDGDAAYLAGAEYTLGREWDGCQHAYSLVPRFVDEHNQLRSKNYDVGWMDATDVVDVSRAYRIGRQYAWRGAETPENTHYTVVGPQLGVREGRRIIGEYVLHQDDLLLDKRFDDVVMRCYAHHENHAFDYANESDLSQIWIEVLGKWKLMFGGDVPYRCLVPKRIDGLLIGCRALSADRDCGMMLRMQRDMQKIGEVAGAAAALSVKEGVLPRQLDVRRLQERLIARGVIGKADLSRESSPWLLFEGETKEDRQRPLRDGITDEDIKQCIAYLGGSQEDTALWWLWQFGDRCVPLLLEVLRTTAGRQQRGVAFALGLLKHPAGVPYLVETFRRRDNDRPNTLAHTEERWVAALILLRRMGDPSVARDVLDLLSRERKSTLILLLLHYLIAVAEKMTPEQKRKTAASVGSMLADQDLGNDYLHYGSGDTIPALPETRSIKWSIELTAAYLLEVAGGGGQPIFERYFRDERGYVRGAAAAIFARLSETKGETQT
ncbi:FAD-dependent oxidoreductase [Paenibacillus alkalitolerans]|uniref:FAD-dependent oxidoreductase n=1 Tax=Paenibacillus alkalitolerans TaxID=2799335 RepID=UPI0018F42FE1|nr:FAD-dependent oxidoreductase [Paenibacillus alkalitolerans]